MSVKSERYSAGFFAQLIGADKRSVCNWCRNGAIKATRDQNGIAWHISWRSMVDFLHRNPRYLRRMEKKMKTYTFMPLKKSVVYNYIIEEFDSRVKVFSTSMLADRLYIDKKTVLDWAHHGKLVPCDERSVSGDILFTETEIMKFLDQHPKYKDTWDDEANQDF